MTFQSLLQKPAFTSAPMEQPLSKSVFPVFERPIDLNCGDDSHKTISTHKAICRPGPYPTSKPTVLGIVGDGYKVVHNRDLFAAVEKAIEGQAPGHVHSVKTLDKVANNGAFSVRQYTFPDLKFTISQRNGRTTDVAYRTVIWNTYDGSGAAKLITGAIDFFCTNGMVTGQFDVFKRRHTAGFVIPDFAALVAKNLASFQGNCETWQRWADKELTRGRADMALKSLPGMSARKSDKLLDQYDYEASQRGPSVWSLYSALTWYSSHAEGDFKMRDTGQDHEAQTLQRREEEVASWTNSHVFQDLLAA